MTEICHPVRFAVAATSMPATATNHPSAGRPLAHPAVLAWDPTEPGKIELRFTERTWLFALDLLTKGLTAPAGIGDVVVAPAGDRINIVLRHRTASATLQFSTDEVLGFVEAVQQRWAPVGIDDDQLTAAVTRWAAEAKP